MAGRKRGRGRRLREPLRSPGRPGVARREDRQRFRLAIAAGRSSEDAARDGGVSQAVGSRWFREAGSMPLSRLAPSAPPPSGRHLSFAEREIALLRVQGQGVREIGRRTRRAGSTISRELRRNAATRSGRLEYRATTAQWHADRAARRLKAAKLATNDALRRYVEDRLAGRIARPDGTLLDGPRTVWRKRRHGLRQARRWAWAWSPEQIPARLGIDFPEDETMRISHEAIYHGLDNLANIAFEWTVAVARARLRPRYREGFGQAPLNLRWQPDLRASPEGGADGSPPQSRSPDDPNLVRGDADQRAVPGRGLRAPCADQASTPAPLPGDEARPEHRADDAEG